MANIRITFIEITCMFPEITQIFTLSNWKLNYNNIYLWNIYCVNDLNRFQFLCRIFNLIPFRFNTWTTRNVYFFMWSLLWKYCFLTFTEFICWYKLYKNVDTFIYWIQADTHAHCTLGLLYCNKFYCKVLQQKSQYVFILFLL